MKELYWYELCLRKEIKMKRAKFLSVFFIVLTLFLAITACRVPEKEPSVGLEFSENEDGTGYCVTGIGICSDLDVVIPASYNDLPVTEIGKKAFASCTELTSVIIPKSITKIGEYAFLRCSSLTEIEIPDGVTTIGAEAFADCYALRSVRISKSVSEMGYGVFVNCSVLSNIHVAEDNPVYHSAGNCLLETESKTLIAGSSISAIPSDGSVTSIGASAFNGRHSMTFISIPDTITSIGQNAFFGCTNLTSIQVGEGVSTIYLNAFDGCRRLYVVYNNSEMKLSFGSSNEEVCKNAKIIVDKDGNKRYLSQAYLDTEDQFLFQIVDETYKLIAYFGQDETVTLPTDINGSAYEICEISGVQNLIIPEGIDRIGANAFDGCNSLKSITIAESVAEIGTCAFRFCISLEQIVYRGTMEQWQQIRKADYWYGDKASFTIRCTDGIITE